jgi:formylmethanofuran dehydrogenase subunit B
MMKETKQSTKVKTTCPFCLYGCELAIVASINNYVQNIEYPSEARVNQGRLCPRGNSASIILGDKKRMSSPIFRNKEISWAKAMTEITQIIKSFDKNEIAITFDKNLTEEEIAQISGFADTLGIENFASSYLEPEFNFSYRLENCSTATLEDINKAKVFVLVGDVFGQTPVIAKPILNARYADRNNRIFVIDSIKTRTAGFADKFLFCRPGTESLLLSAMSSLLSGKIKGLEIETIADVAGVSVNSIETVAKAFSNINPGVLIAAMSFGRNENPFLFSLAGQILAVKAGGEKKFLGTGEARSDFGKTGFGPVYTKIKQGAIKALINFGDTFPHYYPQLKDIISRLDTLITTAVFKPRTQENELTLSVASNLEKSGMVKTLWGEAKITKTLNPFSGSKTVKEIIELIDPGLALAKNPGPKYEAKVATTREVYELARDFLATKQQSSEKDKLLLLGEKPAIGFLNIFDPENIIKMNPADCTKLNLRENDSVKVASANHEIELIVRTTNQVPKGVTLVGVNRIENRQLFPMVIDNATNNVIFPPTKINVWQKG